MHPACLRWMSSGSMCPCTCSAGPWCAAMCHRKESSKLLGPIISTWPCCWSSSSCPLCLPYTPSSPSPHHLTVDPSGRLIQSLNKALVIYDRITWLSVTITLFPLVARIVCLMWFMRHWNWTSQPGLVKYSAMPPTLDWCYLSYYLWCESAVDYVVSTSF